jgi:hypothetical protein
MASPSTEMIDSWQKSLEKLVERKLKHCANTANKKEGGH